MINMKKSFLAMILSAVIVSDAQAEISDDIVKIGYLADMSGTYRDLVGPNGLAALEMAVDDFGGKVGMADIQIVSADDLNATSTLTDSVLIA